MKLINPGYESNTDLDKYGNIIMVNNSLWWDSQSGTCYNGSKNKTTTCDFTSGGLSDTVKNKIATVVWNTGGHDNTSIYPNQIYSYERGNNVIQNPSDGITRNTSWTGKVALIYPSDYGYATDFTKCSKTLNNYYTSPYACSSNDWLFNNFYRWLLTSHSNWVSNVWQGVTNTTCDYSSDFTDSDNGVWPTFYLKSDVMIIDGIGTKDNPYVIE